MDSGILNETRVDRCQSCFGIWFRGSDFLSLRKVQGSEKIDVGPAELGREFDQAIYVPCPDCGKPMERSSHPSQPHIRFEACPGGHGVFFDAGEYRDFKEKTIGDLFRRMISPASD